MVLGDTGIGKLKLQLLSANTQRRQCGTQKDGHRGKRNGPKVVAARRRASARVRGVAYALRSRSLSVLLPIKRQKSRFHSTFAHALQKNTTALLRLGSRTPPRCSRQPTGRSRKSADCSARCVQKSPFKMINATPSLTVSFLSLSPLRSSKRRSGSCARKSRGSRWTTSGIAARSPAGPPRGRRSPPAKIPTTLWR